MPLFIIDIHWERRSPQEGKRPSGFSTYAAAGRTVAAATRKATRKFNLQFGMHLRLTSARHRADLERISA